jgi:hypothetical protein
VTAASAEFEQRVQLAQIERLEEQLEAETFHATTRRLARVAGDDDDPDRGVEPLDLANRLEAVQARHRQIEQHERGPVVLDDPTAARQAYGIQK